MNSEQNKVRVTIYEICLFGMYGALMFALKKLMEVLPNIHLVAVMIIAITVVYRKKALFPIAVYIFLDGVFLGFSPFWLPYIYLWPILWGAIMVLPMNMKDKNARIVYTLICAIHGLLFGILYAPADALIRGMNFEQMIGWIATGFLYDLIHSLGNLVGGFFLIMPIIKVLKLGKKIN